MNWHNMWEPVPVSNVLCPRNRLVQIEDHASDRRPCREFDRIEVFRCRPHAVRQRGGCELGILGIQLPMRLQHALQHSRLVRLHVARHRLLEHPIQTCCVRLTTVTKDTFRQRPRGLDVGDVVQQHERLLRCV